MRRSPQPTVRAPPSKRRRHERGRACTSHRRADASAATAESRVFASDSVSGTATAGVPELMRLSAASSADRLVSASCSNCFPICVRRAVSATKIGSTPRGAPNAARLESMRASVSRSAAARPSPLSAVAEPSARYDAASGASWARRSSVVRLVRLAAKESRWLSFSCALSDTARVADSRPASNDESVVRSTEPAIRTCLRIAAVSGRARTGDSVARTARRSCNGATTADTSTMMNAARPMALTTSGRRYTLRARRRIHVGARTVAAIGDDEVDASPCIAATGSSGSPITFPDSDIAPRSLIDP